MKPYAEFRPSKYDTKGLGLPDRQYWLTSEELVITRESGTLYRSNFRTALRMLGALPASEDDFETHTFNHWACGWFKIILVKPDTAAHALLTKLDEKVCDYRVLDEDDWSALDIEEEGRVA